MNHAISALALILLLPGAALAEMTGPVNAIEGDVIEIRGERVRLFGIDADAPKRRQAP